MIDGIPPGLLTGGGVVGVVVYVGWLFYTGRVLSRKAHEEILTRADQRAEDYKATAAAVQARADITAEQLGEILSFIRRPPREGG